MTSPAAVARVITWAGVVLFWATLAVLVWVAEMPVVDSILLAVLLAAVPAFSLAQVPLIEGADIARLPAYWGSIVTLWLLGTACWFVGTRVDGAAAVGLVSIGTLPLLAWSLALTAGGMAIVWLFRAIGLRADIKESRLLRQLLPRSAQERRVFALLSLAAGSGEEIAYRGYSIPVLAPLLGVPGAAVLTTLIFGVLHSYQGWVGIVRTSVLGGMLAWGFLASGSLWPSIIAHTAIDLLAGIVFGQRLLSPEVPIGVPESDT